MSSQSSFVHSSSPDGLGRLAIPMTDPMVYEDQLILQPIDSRSGSGSTFKPSPLPVTTPTFSPTPDQMQEAITTTAATDPTPHVAANHDKGWVSMMAGLIRFDGNYVVIGGERRIQKKTLLVAGGAVFTAGLLVALIR